MLSPFELAPLWSTPRTILFLVIENFKQGDPRPVGERFKQRGRMLPKGVTYHASWVDSTGSRCFQIMEAPRPECLHDWTIRWGELIDFEIVPVQPSAEFWARTQIETA